MQLKFTKDKETKNKVRYEEQTKGDDAPVVGTLYVTKAAVEEHGFGDNVLVEVSPN